MVCCLLCGSVLPVCLLEVCQFFFQQVENWLKPTEQFTKWLTRIYTTLEDATQAYEQGVTSAVGDVLFKGSIGRTDFPRSDHASLLAAIRERLFPLGDDVQFVPGHGPASTFGEERLYNPFVGERAAPTYF